MKKSLSLFAVLLAAISMSAPAATQDKGGVDLHGPYDVVANWLKPVEDGMLTHPVAVFIAFVGDLFGGGYDALRALGLAAHPDHDEAAGVGAAVPLDDAADDLALAGGELAVVLLVLGIAQPLQDHLPCGGGRDAAESLWGVVPFVEDVAVFVGLARHHLNDAGLAVDLDAGVGFVPLGVAIGGEQRGLDGVDDDIDGDALVGLDGVQCGHVDIHAPAPFPGWPASSSSRWFGGENSTWTTALAIPLRGSSRTV